MLEIRNLTKRYGRKLVLNDLNYKFKNNRIIGLLGANGEGKTTLLKIISGFLQSYRGEVLIDGEKLSFEHKGLISFLPESPVLDSLKSINNAINYYDDMFEFDEKKAVDMLDFFSLNRKMKFSELSKGMKEKVAISLCLSRKAKIYLLDEPIGGVDPSARSIILENIIKNHSENSTLVISTHIINEVETILDEALFLKDNTIVASGESDYLRAKYQMSINELFKKIYGGEVCL